MERVLTSPRFLVSTAICCGLTVAGAIWAVGDASGGVRALAGLIALVAGLAVMLLIAAASAEAPSGTVATPIVVSAVVPAPLPRDPEGHDVLARRLDEGRRLRQQLRPGSIDLRVDFWVEDVRTVIERWRPGAAGYFDALAQRAYADDGLRLDACTRRLETIVRDY